MYNSGDTIKLKKGYNAKVTAVITNENGQTICYEVQKYKTNNGKPFKGLQIVFPEHIK
jgi:hypothetical protein